MTQAEERFLEAQTALAKERGWLTIQREEITDPAHRSVAEMAGWIDTAMEAATNVAGLFKSASGSAVGGKQWDRPTVAIRERILKHFTKYLESLGCTL